MNKNRSTRSMSAAFTLIEMIGVLAIIGILASVVSPKVIEAIRDAKVTGVIANLAAAKTAAATYYGRYNSYPVDGTKLAVVSAATSDEPKQSPSPSLGELLVSTKKIDRVAFPMGQKNLLPEDGEPDPLQIHQPKILAVSLPSLADYFKNPQLFSSARSSQVAVLVVPYLDESEAESIQKIIGSLSELQNGKTVYRGDCFFTRSSVEGKFNGWIYLSDL